MKDNPMRKVKIEKVVLNIGAKGEELDKAFILLERLTGRKPVKRKAKKRIPTWEVRPGLEVGVIVTLRKREAIEKLRQLLGAVNNSLKEKQIQENHLSFGIKEYIDIPGVEYIREVGMMGLEVDVSFFRSGKKVSLRKIKRGKIRRMYVSKEEIIKFMEENFKTKILRRKK
ncbi:MAG: 50S ribosomal protein L5 [Candidatus Pacearchaeota archaeon]